MKPFLFFLAALFLCSASAEMSAQVKLGADIYSRYIWRGADFGSSGSFQPALTYTKGDFSIGAWGAYSIAKSDSTTYSENDIWLSYALGPVTLYVTDYYVPTPATPPFFNYSNSGGVHVVEVGAGYTVGESLPLTVAGYVNVLNDADRSIYVQASYPVLEELSLSVGLVPAKSAYYGTTKLGVTNVGIATNKTIKITESFSLPFNVQYIMNPLAEKAYLIFGISL